MKNQPIAAGTTWAVWVGHKMIFAGSRVQCETIKQLYDRQPTTTQKATVSYLGD